MASLDTEPVPATTAELSAAAEALPEKETRPNILGLLLHATDKHEIVEGRESEDFCPKFQYIYLLKSASQR